MHYLSEQVVRIRASPFPHTTIIIANKWKHTKSYRMYYLIVFVGYNISESAKHIPSYDITGNLQMDNKSNLIFTSSEMAI